MEMQFQRTSRSCLDMALCEVKNTEQTLELRLSDGMPDIGRVVASWGQCVLRSKEWHPDSVTITGGITVWVLYAPEEGTEPRMTEGWLPFQMKWDLPQDCPEGKIRIRMLLRSADARSVSARKMILRAGVAVMAEAYVPVEEDTWFVEEVPEDVQLLRSHYPVRFYKAAGEKVFQLDEDLTLPGSAPQPEKLIYYTMSPEVTDAKVLGDKVVFRGNGNLHLLYRSEEGQIHSWDFPVSFSQFAQLGNSYSPEAKVDVAMCVTNLELELDDEGHLRMKSALAGQYLVDDREILEIIEDAYSPQRELTKEYREGEFPVVLESRTESIQPEQTIQADANLAADVRFLPDFPRQYPNPNGVKMELPGIFQALYYGDNGNLQGSAARWEGQQEISADTQSVLTAVPMLPGEPQFALGEGSVTMKTQLPVRLTTVARQSIPMVTGIRLEELREPDPGRPSLILYRAGNGSLWQLAKENGSTVAAIEKANNLQEEPEPGRMLLIPVP